MEDAVSINFNPDSRIALNFLLAFIMFGVALDLSWADVLRAIKTPKATGLGLLSQFLLLPAATFLIVFLWVPKPELALGMFLVAACPGGTVSNFMSSLAKADLGLSVTLTAIATIACLFFTPFNFELWSGAYSGTSELLKEVKLDAVELFKTVFLFLILPVFAGMLVRDRQPVFTARIVKPIRWMSMAIFLSFVSVAFLNNRENFLKHADLVLALVMVHNLAAFVIGYSVGKIGKLGEPASRSLAIETGIQNSGLGLIICFQFFPAIGEMALLCATWGIWHIITGLTLSFFWSKRSLKT